MILKKLEKFLLLLANGIYLLYVGFLISWINKFKSYTSESYLRKRLVSQIREQTKLTMDSANISTKDLDYIFEIMGKLSYLYVVVFFFLFLLIIFLQIYSKNYYIFAFILLIYSIFFLIFSLGILFISCIIYFYVGLKIIINAKNRELINSNDL